MTIKEIGREEGLFGLSLYIFENYINIRGMDKYHDSYIKKWAQRFSKGDAWNCSDLEGQRTLTLILGSRDLAMKC